MHQRVPRYYPSNYTFNGTFVSSIPQLAYFINNQHSGKITLCEAGTQVPLNLAHHTRFMSNVVKYLQQCLKTSTSLQTHTPINSQDCHSYQPLPLNCNLRGWRTTLPAQSTHWNSSDLHWEIFYREETGGAWETIPLKVTAVLTSICFHSNCT